MALFVLFLLIIALSFLLRLTASGYPFAIFNHFLHGGDRKTFEEITSA
jgi:hypothetical protein